MRDKPFHDAMKESIDSYATENFRNGLNCAESVYEALLRSGALKAPKETLAMCTGFGGGVGLAGSLCGALLAAVMANGAVYGRFDPWAVPREERGRETSSRHYRRYNRIYHRFREENGGVTCLEICEPFGGWNSRERRKNCLRIVRATAMLTYDYLLIPQDEGFILPYGENIGDLK